MNRKQIITLLIALSISLLSVLLRPRIYWKDVHDVVHNMETKQRIDRIHYVIIPGISLSVGIIVCMLLRKK